MRKLTIAKPCNPTQPAIWCHTEGEPDADGRQKFFVENGCWYGMLAADKKTLRVIRNGEESEDLDCIVLTDREIEVVKDEYKDEIPF